jgi:hypothetical protein
VSAVLSPCGAYRYALWRDVGELGNEGTVLFVGLNPSTADATKDDPTIRRCVRFAREWGYARLAMANCYAVRSTKPAGIELADDPVGPDNDEWLQKLAGNALHIIAAWGASPHLTPEREARVLDVLTYGGSMGIDCLGQTDSGRPRHPLYLRADTRPRPLRQEAISR